MCIVKMPLKVYVCVRIQRVLGMKPNFSVKESKTQEKKSYIFNVYGIMIFLIETALRYSTVRMK